MVITLHYWFLFPISIAVATLAMASGIGGAVFFSPIFLLWLKLAPTVAVGIALLTELFGFGSGLIAYMRSRRIDYHLAATLLVFSVPAAALGVVLSDQFPAIVLKAIFATGLVFLGSQLFTSWRREQKEKLDAETRQVVSGLKVSKLIDRNGEVFTYTVCHKSMGEAFVTIGGLFLGMISVGLAELQEYHLVAKCRVPSAVAIATSIFVVVCTVLVAVLGHGYTFLTRADHAMISKVAGIAAFTVPGVLIGGQIGPRIGAHLNSDALQLMVSGLFVSVGLFMFVTLAW